MNDFDFEIAELTILTCNWRPKPSFLRTLAGDRTTRLHTEHARPRVSTLITILARKPLETLAEHVAEGSEFRGGVPCELAGQRERHAQHLQHTVQVARADTPE